MQTQMSESCSSVGLLPPRERLTSAYSYVSVHRGRSLGTAGARCWPWTHKVHGLLPAHTRELIWLGVKILSSVGAKLLVACVTSVP